MNTAKKVKAKEIFDSFTKYCKYYISNIPFILDVLTSLDFL